jgi:hypothetical protein
MRQSGVLPREKEQEQSTQAQREFIFERPAEGDCSKETL